MFTEPSSEYKAESGYTTHPGSISYLPPQAFSDKAFTRLKQQGRHGSLGDTYALGCVFWEMLNPIWNTLPNSLPNAQPNHRSLHLPGTDQSFAAFWKDYRPIAEDPFNVRIQKYEHDIFEPFQELWFATRDRLNYVLGSLDTELPREFLKGHADHPSKPSWSEANMRARFAEDLRETIVRVWCHITGMTKHPRENDRGYDMSVVYYFRDHFNGFDQEKYYQLFNMLNPALLRNCAQKTLCSCNGLRQDVQEEAMDEITKVFSCAAEGKKPTYVGNRFIRGDYR